MPSSHPCQLNEIVDAIIRTRPRNLLDVGVGFGKYGVLAREYLDLGDGRDQYNDWQIRMDGIEAFAGYLTPVHDYIYDHIYVGDALEVVPRLEIQYDLALIIDVLEHFTYQDGVAFLKVVMGKAKNVLVSTPKDIGHQGAAFGNSFERHQSQWVNDDLSFLPDRFVVPNRYSLIVYAGIDAPRLKHEMAWRGPKAWISHHAPIVRAGYQLVGRHGAQLGLGRGLGKS